MTNPPADSLSLQRRRIEEFRQLEQPYQKELAGLTITIFPHVFRGGTDSELLCESMDIHPGDKVLDLCTGNGIIAIKAALAGAKQVVATDLNPNAVQNAQANCQQLDLKNVEVLETDLFPPTKTLFDIITINPPYTDYQAPDLTAICFWDKDNLVVRRFFHNLDQYLKPTGKAYLTWSNFASPTLLPELAAQTGYTLELINQRAGKSGFQYLVFRVEKLTAK